MMRDFKIILSICIVFVLLSIQGVCFDIICVNCKKVVNDVYYVQGSITLNVTSSNENENHWDAKSKSEYCFDINSSRSFDGKDREEIMIEVYNNPRCLKPSVASKTITVIFDTTPPQITFLQPEQKENVNTNTQLNVKITDDFSLDENSIKYVCYEAGGQQGEWKGMGCSGNETEKTCSVDLQLKYETQ
ncbi:MAG: hypothetical protein QXY04_03460 [archaeon]